MTTTSSDALVGRLLDGRYRVGQRIARGGMASVHVGTDERLDRVVAIKIMRGDLGDDEAFTARFVQEARAAARLHHPSVVSVFDQGEDDGLVFLVMEYVPGRTLRDVVRAEAPMRPARALELLDGLLVALAVAHDHGIVHRDVKPENVLIDPAGRVKVADFGLARAVSAATTATASSGTLIGTLSYLAPELVTGIRADARSDVYACGAVLYEMLTADKPHRGDSPIQVAYKHVHEDVPAPSATVDGVPPYVDALVARATARDRDQRSPDASVLLHQVRQARRALEAGLDDDLELTADLTPHRPARPLPATTLPESVELLGDVEAFPEQQTVAVHPAPSWSAPARAAGPAARAATRDDLDDRFATVPRDDVATAAMAAVPPASTVSTAEQHAADQHAAERTTAVPRLAPAPPAVPPPVRPAVREAAEAHGRARRRRGLVLLVVVLVLAVLAATFGWYWGVGRYDQAPDVTGMTAAAATREADGSGYRLVVGREAFSETAARGTVISTSPDPGGKILPEGTMTAVVSKGKERYAVPDLAGRSQDDAARALEELTLEVGDVALRWSEKVPRDEVIRTVLDTGTQVKRGTQVDLLVSRGRKPIEVTDVTGEPADEVAARFEETGLEVRQQRRYDADVPKGRVVAQDPRDGTLYRGDTLTLTVSDGPEPVAVPTVVGRNEDAARQALEEAGFEVEVERDRSYVGFGFVIRQDPRGEDAPPGSTVTITVV